MFLDFSQEENKKYIPYTTFALGLFVGGLLMHLYMEKKKGAMFEKGGAISPAPQIIQVTAAPSPVISAPVPSIPAAGEMATSIAA